MSGEMKIKDFNQRYKGLCREEEILKEIKDKDGK